MDFVLAPDAKFVAEAGKNMLLTGNGYRWLYPIGPAPEGWEVIEGCSQTIPHYESDEQWQNDEMNADHYTARK